MYVNIYGVCSHPVYSLVPANETVQFVKSPIITATTTFSIFSCPFITICESVYVHAPSRHNKANVMQCNTFKSMCLSILNAVPTDRILESGNRCIRYCHIVHECVVCRFTNADTPSQRSCYRQCLKMLKYVQHSSILYLDAIDVSAFSCMCETTEKRESARERENTEFTLQQTWHRINEIVYSLCEQYSTKAI